jgi:uncharacterized protein YrrD
MTVQPEIVKQSHLLNQLVLNHSTMEELGRVEVLWMYPQAHRVLGFVCKSGFLGNRKLAFKLSQIEAIGSNGILTHSQPDATDADRVRQLESLIHCEVWSQDGTKLGKIIDCEFNLRSGVITDYLLVGDRLSGLVGTIHRLPSSQIASFGHTRVLVAATSLQSFAIYREGMGQKLSKVTHTLKEEYDQVTEELKTLAKQAQETTQQTTAQFKTLAEQAKEQAWEQAQRLAEQAKEKVQELNEQLHEQLDDPLDKQLDDPLDAPFDAPLDDPLEDWFDEPPNQPPNKPPNEQANQQRNEPPNQQTNNHLGQSQKGQLGDQQESPLPDTWQDNRAGQGVPTTEDNDLLHEIRSFGHNHQEHDPEADLWDVDVDVEEDPWNITEPPTSETVGIGISPPAAHPSPPQSADPEFPDDDDEPWI